MRGASGVVASRQRGFFVAGGGSAGAATDVQAVLDANTDHAVFTLGDGWFTGDISTAGVTVRAQHSRQAQWASGLALNADDITVDGVSRDAEGGGSTITINNPGCTVRDCEVRNFGKSGYATGIFVPESALDVDNAILVDHCLIDDWGENTANHFGAGISVGLQDGTDASHLAPFSGTAGEGGQRAVRIMHCTVTNGPTTNLPYAGGIQVLHPAEIGYNFVSGVHNSPLQVKAGNSWMHHNEITNPGVFDGCIYNRAWADGNVWEYNFAYDSTQGLDHFQGDDCTYRYNVIARCDEAVRVKDENDDGNGGAGTDNMVFERNTVYDIATGSQAWQWDLTGQGGTYSNIAIDDNVWVDVDGAIIETNAGYAATSGAGNVFHNVGSTQANVGGTTADPQLADPANDDFTVGNGTYAGVAGAPWPFPVGPQ